MKLTEEGKYNLKLIPFVLFIRAPILLPIWIMSLIVENSEFLHDKLPGFKPGKWYE